MKTQASSRAVDLSLQGAPLEGRVPSSGQGIVFLGALCPLGERDVGFFWQKQSRPLSFSEVGAVGEPASNG